MARFESKEVAHAVKLQHSSYRLLKWMAEAVQSGLLGAGGTHAFASLPEATVHWIDMHREQLPPEMRPAVEDVQEFSNFFATYLSSSFDMVSDPGQRSASNSRCHCSVCMWLVQAPNLQPKKLTSGNKRRATLMQVDWVVGLADTEAKPISRSDGEVMVCSAAVREPTALGAYGAELLLRCRGFSTGPSTLALWRRFAWNAQGSPKRPFVLTAEMILAAEASVVAAL